MGKTYMGVWDETPNSFWKGKGCVCPFVGEGSIASCLSLECNKLSASLVSKPHFLLIHFLHHREDDSFQNKDQSYVLKKQQCWSCKKVHPLWRYTKGTRNHFEWNSSVNVVLFLLLFRLICWVQFKKATKAQTGQSHKPTVATQVPTEKITPNKMVIHWKNYSLEELMLKLKF